jgi:O-antigen/teichoic acid export membrane protein
MPKAAGITANGFGCCSIWNYGFKRLSIHRRGGYRERRLKLRSFKELVTHASHYFVGQLLILIGGFISMPIMTRLLTKEEYGVMNLVFVTLGWLGPIARLGFPPSITRFYAEYKKKGDGLLQSFCSNILFGTVLSATVVVSGTVLASYVLEKNSSFSHLGPYLRIASLLVLVRAINGVLQEIRRAEKRHFLFNLALIISKYGTLLCSISLLYIYKDVMGVFVGSMIAEFAVLVIFLIHLIVEKKIGLVKISRDLLGVANKYGFPLVLVGSAATILDSGDRYVIQYFLNSAAVANYSVVYDLSSFLASFLLTPIRLAIVPIIFSLWTDQGDEATTAFAAKALKHIFLLIIPVILGFSALGKEIIAILASAKYADTGGLIPYVIAGLLIGEINFLLTSGLRTQKKTAILAWITVASGVLNVILNVIFVPYYGIKGSAIITLFSYLLHTTVCYKISSKYLAMKIDFKSIFKAIGASVVMIILMLIIGDVTRYALVNLGVRILIGVFSYGVLLLLLDRELKEDVFAAIKSKNFFLTTA